MGCGWFPMITGNRAVWRSLGGLLLLLGVVTGSGYGLAEDSSEGFSATVKVDATADSAAAARELARIDGQRRALMMVIDRLSGSPDSAKLSKLDDKTITDMVESFEVANERMSARVGASRLWLKAAASRSSSYPFTRTPAAPCCGRTQTPGARLGGNARPNQGVPA